VANPARGSLEQTEIRDTVLAMRSLFPFENRPAPLPEIPGLRYLPDYITQAQEQELAAAIDAEPWNTNWERRRQLYGATYGRQDEAVRPIPDWGQDLAARMHLEGLGERQFDQMLINEYLPGQGIAFHLDYEPFDRTVVSLSLLSACVMDFRHVAGDRRESLLLEPRSLLVLSDEARYQWQHGIARRKNDKWQGETIRRLRRLSVTYRLLKRT
jgi:alkylated DNA repair dioxygenase AlkB